MAHLSHLGIFVPVGCHVPGHGHDDVAVLYAGQQQGDGVRREVGVQHHDVAGPHAGVGEEVARTFHRGKQLAVARDAVSPDDRVLVGVLAKSVQKPRRAASWTSEVDNLPGRECVGRVEQEVDDPEHVLEFAKAADRLAVDQRLQFLLRNAGDEIGLHRIGRHRVGGDSIFSQLAGQHLGVSLDRSL